MNKQNNSSQEFFPNNLNTLRKELNITQEDLAELLDVTPKTISNYECEKKQIPISKAFQISKNFGCSLEWLYKLSEDMVDNGNEFLVDIRNIIYKKDNDIVFSISNSYWKYLKEKAEIMNSKMVTYEKRRKLVKLKNNYKNSNDNFVWEFSIKAENFYSLFKISHTVSSPYIITSKVNPNVDEKKLKECKEFLDTCITSHYEEEN